MSYTSNSKMSNLRLEAVKKIKVEGWGVRQTARYYGYTPGAISKWLAKAPDDLRKTISTKSSRPHYHPNALSEEKVKAIIKTRLEHHRCAEVVKKQLDNSGLDISLSSVKRTLSRTGLIRNKSLWKKWHCSLPRPLAEKPGDLLQLEVFITD